MFVKFVKFRHKILIFTTFSNYNSVVTSNKKWLEFKIHSTICQKNFDKTYRIIELNKRIEKLGLIGINKRKISSKCAHIRKD